MGLLCELGCVCLIVVGSCIVVLAGASRCLGFVCVALRWFWCFWFWFALRLGELGWFWPVCGVGWLVFLVLICCDLRWCGRFGFGDLVTLLCAFPMGLV